MSSRILTYLLTYLADGTGAVVLVWFAIAMAQVALSSPNPTEFYRGCYLAMMAAVAGARLGWRAVNRLFNHAVSEAGGA